MNSSTYTFAYTHDFIIKSLEHLEKENTIRKTRKIYSDSLLIIRWMYNSGFNVRNSNSSSL